MSKTTQLDKTNSINNVEADGGDNASHSTMLAPAAPRGGGDVVVADRRAANTLHRQVGQMTFAEAAKWVAQPEHIEHTLQTCMKLQASHKGAYQRSGVRLYLQAAKVIRELLTELRLQQESQPGGMATTEGLTISKATKIIQAVTLKQTAPQCPPEG